MFRVYASEGHTHVRRRRGEHHLPECIRPRYTCLTSGFKVYGAKSYNPRSHLVFLQGKVNNARYSAQVIIPELLPFLRQEDDMLFSWTMRVHIHDAMCSPWCTTTTLTNNIPRSLALGHIWDVMNRKLTLSPEPATTIAELRQRVQDALNKLQDNIRHFYDRVHGRIHIYVACVFHLV